MKKLFAAFLAIVMCMALAVPAFANETGNQEAGDGDNTTPQTDTSEDTTNRKTEYTIDTKTPNVQVTVPSSGAVKLNPYQIKIKDVSALAIGNGENDGETGSVLAAKTFITNKSDVPVKMSITVTGSIPQGSAAKFATGPVSETEQNRAVFMFVDVGAVADAADASALSTATATALCDVTYDSTKLYNASTKTGSQGVVKTGDLKLVDILTIPVPGTGKVANYVPIQIGGNCATTPKDAWTAADTVGVTMTFSFTPTVTSSTSSSTEPVAGG